MLATEVAPFHPIVAGWFADRFGQPTEPQRAGWPLIAADRDVLIAAPTGSGKTLAAFLACLDRLIRRGLSPAGQLGGLEPGVEILYISPLKALSNDIHRNLETPLAELRERAAKDGIALPEIHVAVRTGDTPQAERARMARRPPHILVTTPESLYILLTADKSRAALSKVRTVIVDEIHAVAGSKRGAHLALSLERLDRLVTQGGNPPPSRVGLSATQRPIERIGRMLVGGRREPPAILDSGHARELDVAVELTDDELGPIASNEQLGRVYDRIAELVREHHTTLVFVNTRRLVERVSHQLEERLGREQVVAHHGSLSRKLRFDAERRLKSGEVRCAVATASLELGIDVGAVDLVVQLGSPRSIAVLLQRIGRSGHSLGATPKGRLFALTRDQLCECAALIRGIKAGELDQICVPEEPLDILAQQIVATAACEEVTEDDLYRMVTGAHHYIGLARGEFDRVIEMLSEGNTSRRGRTRALLFRDRIGGVVKGRRGAKLISVTNGGAIGDVASYPVILYPEGTPIGSLDEDFAIESSAGDIFLLGNTSWRIRRIEAGKVLVEDAGGAPPTIPFWFGEAPARTAELSGQVSRLRADVEARIEAGDGPGEIADWLCDEANLPAEGGEQIAAYLIASRAALGALPTVDRIIAERFFDDAGGMQLVLHSPLGGRINKAWGLALRKRFCRSFNFELQAAATDDGVVISLGPPHSFSLEAVFKFLSPQTAIGVLEQAVLDAPVWQVRWRWAATRSLAVQRRYGDKKVPPAILRMRTDDLLTEVFPMAQACLENVSGNIELPDHPLVKEAMRDCLSEFMDAEGLRCLVARFESGEVEVLGRDTSEPSPLCHELLNANPYAFLDDAPLEERRARAVSLPRGLRALATGSDEIGVVSDAAIATAEEQALPPIRDADELHDLLLGLYTVAERPEWRDLADLLIAAGRATRSGSRLIAAERFPIVCAAMGTTLAAAPPLADLPFEVEIPDPDTAAALICRGHLEVSGPVTPAALAERTGLPEPLVAAALGFLEADGSILRGRFSKASRRKAPPEGPGGAERPWAAAEEFCDRRMLARIHRLTLGRLRKQIEPVNAAALMRFLFRWQRVGSEAKLIGIDGLRRVIEQLQGFQSAAGAWERDLIPSRLHSYDPAWLDNLCLSGQVTWARLTPRTSAGGRSAPTRAAPLALMLRDDLDWLRASATAALDLESELSAEGAAIHRLLAERGASFLGDLAAASGLRPRQVEDALWELACAGLAAADGFASLRCFVDREPGPNGMPRSPFDPESRGARSGKWRTAIQRARKRDGDRPGNRGRSLAAAAGRWSLLPPPDPEAVCPESWARQLLCRYGVVFRDLCEREVCLPPWREILWALRRLEARGVIRGGRFVSGFVGEQFALPEALEGLRDMRNAPREPELVEVRGSDPLNLVGVTSAGPKVPAVIGNRILFRDGVPIASIEGGKLVLRAELPPGEDVTEDLVYRGRSTVRIQSFQQPLF
jgi:ATP-dependent Lhr-like helicase